MRWRSSGQDSKNKFFTFHHPRTRHCMWKYSYETLYNEIIQIQQQDITAWFPRIAPCQCSSYMYIQQTLMSEWGICSVKAFTWACWRRKLFRFALIKWDFPFSQDIGNFSATLGSLMKKDCRNWGATEFKQKAVLLFFSLFFPVLCLFLHDGENLLQISNEKFKILCLITLKYVERNGPSSPSLLLIKNGWSNNVFDTVRVSCLFDLFITAFACFVSVIDSILRHVQKTSISSHRCSTQENSLKNLFLA